MTSRYASWFWLLLGSTLVSGCGEEPFPNSDELEAIKLMSPGITAALPDGTNKLLLLGKTEPALYSKANELGKLLFEDEKLSECGSVSCASCHVKSQGYTYSKGPTAPGCHGNSARNPPTLLNIGRYDWFMWDLSRDSLWSQATGPLTNWVEMGNKSDDAVKAALLADANHNDYRARYQELFQEEPEKHSAERVVTNMGKAIELFERSASLVRIDSPFDAAVAQFIATAELSDASSSPLYAGLKVFVRKGNCIACHKGPGLNDGLFHNIGVPDDSEGNQGRAAGLDSLLSTTSAAGNFNASGPYSDDRAGAQSHRLDGLRALANDPAKRAEMVGAFKTASLRNLTLTAPYMHTGQFATLEDVVDFYDKGGGERGTFAGTRTFTIKPLHLSASEKASLLDLLKQLSPQ